MPKAASPKPPHENDAGTALDAAPFLLVVAAAAAAADEGVNVLVDVDTVMVASVVMVCGGTVLGVTTVLAATTDPATVSDSTLVASTVVPGTTVVPVDVDKMYTRLPSSEIGIALPTPDAVNCAGTDSVAVLGFAPASAL